MEEQQKEQYRNFVINLNKFVFDLNRYYPNEGTKKFLEVFDKLDMGKVMIRYINMLREFENELKQRNEIIFSQPLVIFPGINLSQYWQHFNLKQKQKIWTYLQILFVRGEVLLNYKETSEQTSDKNKIIKSIITNINENTNPVKQEIENSGTDPTNLFQLNFNPFVGVGIDKTTADQYSINEMYSSTKLLENGETSFKPGLGSIASFMGLDKMIDIEQLSEQLRNMKKEEIDDATNNIKKLLGGNIDENTSHIITDMLTNISEELKKDDISKGNPIDSIIKIAETVADKMKPSIQSGMDISKLWSSTQNLANECKNEKGESINIGGLNPFDLLNKLVNVENNSQEQCFANCNNILKEMGVNNIDLSKFNLGNLSNSFGQNLPRKKKHKKNKK
ncbi:Hypothetical protein KVN_LOCUS436 [uncultured virus]|nr:Hypothetical protein KVN_LOCUS436 [uncultured virus]